MDPSTNVPVLWPLVVYFASVIFLAGAMIGLSALLGEKHMDRDTAETYESGIPVTGTARLRLNAQFYLVAMFFVIFDLETAIIVAWAVGVIELGWTGYIEILIFIGVLLVALVYLWRLGALDWGTSKSRRTLAERNRREMEGK
jgi:NADH-quinone oxidoreductase subunit A